MRAASQACGQALPMLSGEQAAGVPTAYVAPVCSMLQQAPRSAGYDCVLLLALHLALLVPGLALVPVLVLVPLLALVLALALALVCRTLPVPEDVSEG